MAGCPHHDIRFCPLYHASHEGDGFGCDDGGLADGHCAVARDLDYDMAVGKLRGAKPGYVERIEWNASLAESKEQRARNMRVNGIH